MKMKIVSIGISIIVFIGLTLISFNLSGNDKTDKTIVAKTSPTAGPTEGSNIAVKTTKEPGTSASNKSSKDTETKVDTKSTKESESSDIVIPDLTAMTSNNQVNLSWTNPIENNISNFRIIRTPSKSEGESVVYNITDTKGKFTDKNVKPGIRYYYEILGKVESRSVYSRIASVEIAGKVILRTEAPFMKVNGEEKFFDASKKSKPYIHETTIMIPIKGAVDLLGGSVYWIKETDKTKTKSAILKFRKTEIELFVGKKTMMLNKKEKNIDFAPTIKDGVLYAPYTLIRDYMVCSVTRTKGTLVIEKPIDEPSSLENSKPIQRDLRVSEGQDFKITLVDPTIDGKKWYYRTDNKVSIELKNRKTIDDKDGLGKSEYTFNFEKSGEYKLILKYFNPRLGENYAEQILVYTIAVTPKQ